MPSQIVPTDLLAHLWPVKRHGPQVQSEQGLTKFFSLMNKPRYSKKDLRVAVPGHKYGVGSNCLIKRKHAVDHNITWASVKGDSILGNGSLSYMACILGMGAIGRLGSVSLETR